MNCLPFANVPVTAIRTALPVMCRFGEFTIYDHTYQLFYNFFKFIKIFILDLHFSQLIPATSIYNKSPVHLDIEIFLYKLGVKD